MIYQKHALLRVVKLRKLKHEKFKSNAKKIIEKTKIQYIPNAKGCSDICDRRGALKCTYQIICLSGSLD